MRLRTALPLLTLPAFVLLAACGKAETEPQAATEESAVADAPVSAAPSADAKIPSSAADITLADIDAYERAMTFKTAEIQRVGAEIAASSGDADKQTQLRLSLTGRELDQKVGEASGLDERRYRAVVNLVQTAADKLASIQQTEQMMAAAREAAATPEQAAQADQSAAMMRDQIGDPYAGFSAEVADALKARLPALVALQREQAGLLMRAAR